MRTVLLYGMPVGRTTRVVHGPLPVVANEEDLIAHAERLTLKHADLGSWVLMRMPSRGAPAAVGALGHAHVLGHHLVRMWNWLCVAISERLRLPLDVCV